MLQSTAPPLRGMDDEQVISIGQAAEDSAGSFDNLLGIGRQTRQVFVAVAVKCDAVRLAQRLEFDQLMEADFRRAVNQMVEVLRPEAVGLAWRDARGRRPGS